MRVPSDSPLHFSTGPDESLPSFVASPRRVGETEGLQIGWENARDGLEEAGMPEDDEGRTRADKPSCLH